MGMNLEGLVSTVGEQIRANSKVTVNGLASMLHRSHEDVEELLDRMGIEHRNGWIQGRLPRRLTQQTKERS